MAKRITNAKLNPKQKKSQVKWEFPLKRTNFLIAGIGLVAILIGYGLMSTGLGGDYAAVDGTWNNPLAIVVAPIVLVIGYCVIIPFAIMKYDNKSEE